MELSALWPVGEKILTKISKWLECIQFIARAGIRRSRIRIENSMKSDSQTDLTSLDKQIWEAAGKADILLGEYQSMMKKVAAADGY